NPFVEIGDANLAHHVLCSERREAFSLRAKVHSETVGATPGLLDELLPDDLRKRCAAARERDRPVDAAGHQDECRGEKEEVGSKRENLYARRAHAIAFLFARAFMRTRPC